MTQANFVDVVKHLTDASAAGTCVATVMAALPPVAALFTIIWTALRLYEMAYGLPFHDTPLGTKIRVFLTRDNK